MKRTILFIFILICFQQINAQLDIKYQKPSQEILSLADVPLAPAIISNTEASQLILLYRNQYKSIAELSEQEMRLAGLRINPKNNNNSRERFYYNIKVMNVGEKQELQVTGLPENARLSNFSWSPNEKFFAFNNTTATGVELWVLDMTTLQTKRLTDANLNANMGTPFTWFRDNKHLLVQVIPENKQTLVNKVAAIPTGPRVSVNEGKEAQNRTYQDLLKDKIDEANFEQLANATLLKVGVDGNKTLWKQTAMYTGVSFSPDGEYVLISEISKPFSYLVPYYRFPTTYTVYSKEGEKVKTIAEIPLTEDIPKGFMSTRKGKRNISWRNDKPATLTYVVGLDNGDANIEVPFRDEVFQWEAPFAKAPRTLLKTTNRFNTIIWGNDTIALAVDYWWNTRNMKLYRFNPSNAAEKPQILFDRNYQDKYNNPGLPVVKRNQYGKAIVVLDGNTIFLEGDGYSAEGIYPFIDQYNLATGKTTRIWQTNDTTKLESIKDVVDIKKGKVLTRIEASNEYPNYYIRNIKNNTKQQVTFIKNPFEAIKNVSKEVISYKRDDGVALSATLYLPANYDKKSGEKLPMIMWAYPYEFKDKSSAGQITSSSNQFTYPYYGSPVFWVNKGYAILDNASFPIIGEGDTEPNDTFIKQLVANAKAAIDAVDKLGYIDRERVAVGGHSYGAFMTANLLTHSDLFAAGIARSGAYNRTLTPFGFQSEERNYWEAPEVYNTMSPFMNADKMKGNLLLIHGEADNNSGTYPMQSERYFNALKGLGGNVRLVMLPKESHGYSARESVLHVLWEQDQWLEKYVKNKKK